MLNSFQHFINTHKLCLPNQKILLAISGGLDSVTMLDLFQKTDYNFGLAHCNFKLRGEESDKDEEFVRSIAKAYQSEVHIQSFDTCRFADENGLSIQEAARDLRYSWFEELSNDFGYDHIAVAHHADDQVETFFINLFRASGVRGLKGMPIKREKIIRPLMFAQRKDIEEYAFQNQLAYRDDSSNASDKYLRNKIRHRILPEIENLDIEAKRSILSSLGHLSDDSEILLQLLDEKRKQLFIIRGGNIQVPIARLLKLRPLDTYLFYLLSPYKFNRHVIDKLSIAIESSETGKLFYSKTHKLCLDRNYLIIESISSSTQREEYLIPSVDEDLLVPLQLKFKLFDDFSKDQIKKESSFAYFDYQKLRFPLLVRLWKKGDRFTPFGMKGTQLVSDYLINHKIDRFEKDKTFVLVTNGEIAWLIGHRVSDIYKVTENTKQVLEIHLYST